jgi:hypothetical protein
MVNVIPLLGVDTDVRHRGEQPNPLFVNEQMGSARPSVRVAEKVPHTVQVAQAFLKALFIRGAAHIPCFSGGVLFHPVRVQFQAARVRQERDSGVMQHDIIRGYRAEIVGLDVLDELARGQSFADIFEGLAFVTVVNDPGVIGVGNEGDLEFNSRSSWRVTVSDMMGVLSRISGYSNKPSTIREFTRQTGFSIFD